MERGDESVRINYLIMMVVADAQVHTPPHWFLGYRWQELAAIVTIILAVAGAVSWIVNLAIVKPAARTNLGLQNSLDNLTQELKEMRESSARAHSGFDHRLDDHETRIKLNEHDIEEIRDLIK